MTNKCFVCGEQCCGHSNPLDFGLLCQILKLQRPLHLDQANFEQVGTCKHSAQRISDVKSMCEEVERLTKKIIYKSHKIALELKDGSQKFTAEEKESHVGQFRSWIVNQLEVATVQSVLEKVKEPLYQTNSNNFGQSHSTQPIPISQNIQIQKETQKSNCNAVASPVDANAGTAIFPTSQQPLQFADLNIDHQNPIILEEIDIKDEEVQSVIIIKPHHVPAESSSTLNVDNWKNEDYLVANNKNGINVSSPQPSLSGFSDSPTNNNCSPVVANSESASSNVPEYSTPGKPKEQKRKRAKAEENYDDNILDLRDKRNTIPITKKKILKSDIASSQIQEHEINSMPLAGASKRSTRNPKAIKMKSKRRQSAQAKVHGKSNHHSRSKQSSTVTSNTSNPRNGDYNSSSNGKKDQSEQKMTEAEKAKKHNDLLSNDFVRQIYEHLTPEEQEKIVEFKYPKWYSKFEDYEQKNGDLLELYKIDRNQQSCAFCAHVGKHIFGTSWIGIHIFTVGRFLGHYQSFHSQPVPCKICGEKFESMSKLAGHRRSMATHPNEKHAEHYRVQAQ